MVVNENKNNKTSNSKKVREYIVSILIAVLVAVIFHTYVFARANVDGPSMQPTLHTNDELFIEKISTELGIIKRGEIVIFKNKETNGDYYVKRVIGVEGDEIEIKDGHVFLNGQLLKETYLAPNTVTEPITAQTKYIIPKGYVFVLGDNRANSTDSRILGPINIKDIEGHVVARIFPFNMMKIFYN